MTACINDIDRTITAVVFYTKREQELSKGEFDAWIDRQLESHFHAALKQFPFETIGIDRRTATVRCLGTDDEHQFRDTYRRRRRWILGNTAFNLYGIGGVVLATEVAGGSVPRHDDLDLLATIEAVSESEAVEIYYRRNTGK